MPTMRQIVAEKLRMWSQTRTDDPSDRADLRVAADWVEQSEATTFAWLIEAPGPRYIGARYLGKREFYWTDDPLKAVRFFNQEQCDAAYMAIRESEPDLFAFERVLTDAKAVEHGFVVNDAA